MERGPTCYFQIVFLSQVSIATIWAASSKWSPSVAWRNCSGASSSSTMQHDPVTVFVMPHEPETRNCPGSAPALWRSENGGDSWRRLGVGLPKKDTYFTVQRDAMTIDGLTNPALYFGTTTGQIWMGRNGGEKFECLFDALPPIHNVKVAVV